MVGENKTRRLVYHADYEKKRVSASWSKTWPSFGCALSNRSLKKTKETQTQKTVKRNSEKTATPENVQNSRLWGQEHLVLKYYTTLHMQLGCFSF